MKKRIYDFIATMAISILIALIIIIVFLICIVLGIPDAVYRVLKLKGLPFDLHKNLIEEEDFWIEP